MTHDIIEDKRNIIEADEQWDSGIAFGPGTNTYRLVKALLSEADRIDGELEEIYDQTHINTATGKSLEKIGDLVDVNRQTGEGDGKYRARIKGNFRASTTGTTYNDFSEFVATVLNTDIDNLNFLTSYDAEPATVTVNADPSVYQNTVLTAQDIVSIVEQGVPAGHAVNLTEGGTFRLKEDGDIDDPSKGLTSDSISTGGTLAEDLLA